VVLCIDADRLTAALRWETPAAGDAFSAERFPHVYGAIDLDAVVDVRNLVRSPDGTYAGF
jgi:uncharacterized protein (DUF952 family)